MCYCFGEGENDLLLKGFSIKNTSSKVLRFRKSRRSIFLRMLYGYIVLTIFTVSLITFILYNIFSINSIREINKISIKMLGQTRYSADFIWNWASTYGYGLYYDNTISYAMHTDDFDQLIQAQADRKLTQSVTSNPLIDSIYVYNGSAKRFISSVTFALDEKDFFDSSIIQYLKKGNTGYSLNFIPRKAEFNLYNQTIYHDFITIVIHRNTYYGDSLSGALIINISVKKFDEFIQSMNPEKNSTFFIMNEHSEIISHTDPSNFLSDFSEKSYIKSIYNLNEDEGSFIEKADEAQSLVSFVRLDRLNWWFVSVIPYDIALENVLTTRNTMIFIALLILLSLVTIDFFFTRLLYSPVRELVNHVRGIIDPASKQNKNLTVNDDIEYLAKAFSKIIEKTDSLEENFRNNAMFIRNEMLKNIILNNYTSSKYTKKNFEELNIELDECGLLVVVMLIDNYKALQKMHSEDSLSLFRFSINNIASELLSKEFNNEAVDMGNEYVAIIVNVENSEPGTLSKLKDICEDIRSAVLRYLELSITTSIGGYVETLENICVSYNIARQQLNYRIVFGAGSIISSEMTTIDPEQKYKYPESMEKSILDNLKLRNLKKVDYYIYKFLESIIHYSYNNIVLSLINLANSSISTLKQICGNNREFLFSELHNILDIIESSSGMEDIKHWFMSIYESCINALEIERDTYREEIIRKTQEYIQNNYSNPLLSINDISETVNLSPNYLRALFKEATGETISEYINKNRFEAAYKLLKTSSYTTARIAEMTGFNSTTYFYTAFKKRFGITPDNCRRGITSY